MKDKIHVLLINDRCREWMILGRSEDFRLKIIRPTPGA